MIDEQEAYTQVLDWLDEERTYTLEKFGSEDDRRHTRQWMDRTDFAMTDWWTQQFDNYYHRAWLLGLDTPGGRQALAKFVATAAGMLAAAVQEYGKIPKAGLPSGYFEKVSGDN